MYTVITTLARKSYLRIYFTLREPLNLDIRHRAWKDSTHRRNASCPRFTPVTLLSPRAAAFATDQCPVNKDKVPSTHYKSTEYRGWRIQKRAKSRKQKDFIC